MGYFSRCPKARPLAEKHASACIAGCVVRDDYPPHLNPARNLPDTLDSAPFIRPWSRRNFPRHALPLNGRYAPACIPAEETAALSSKVHLETDTVERHPGVRRFTGIIAALASKWSA